MSESHEIEQIARDLCRAQIEENERHFPRRNPLPSIAIAERVDDTWGGFGNLARLVLPLIRAAEERGAVDMRERAAGGAAAWRKPANILLAAGDMTAQELRTAQAVAGGIEAAIRSLPPIKEGRI